MRVFKSVHVDDETKGIMVYSECTYNSACYELEKAGFECEEAKSIDTRFTKIKGKLYDPIAKRKRDIEYLYDEKRGYLIRTALA